MKSTFKKERIVEIINEEISRLSGISDGSNGGMMNEAMNDLKKASALIQSAAQMLDQMEDSKVDGAVNNLMAMNENLYSLIQTIKNADYEHESHERPWEK